MARMGRCDGKWHHPFAGWTESMERRKRSVVGGAPRRACVRGECDHMQGDRFRHAAIFLRWRFDKQPKDCRCDQLEVTTPYELDKVFRS